jgi:hypothetical protein
MTDPIAMMRLLGRVRRVSSGTGLLLAPTTVDAVTQGAALESVTQRPLCTLASWTPRTGLRGRYWRASSLRAPGQAKAAALSAISIQEE